MRETSMERWCHPKLIVVATNLLEGPAVMLEAVQQAKHSRAQILLVHVIRPSASTPKVDRHLPRFVPSPALELARADLNLLARQFQYEGVLCEPILLEGHPAEQIERLVSSRNVDRVIVAASGHRGVEHLILGSLTEALAGELSVPVCILGRHVSHRSANPKPHILAATSLRPSSALCPIFAAGLARANGGSLTLLHVLELPPAGPSAYTEARKRAVIELHDSLSPEETDFCKPEYLVGDGTPAEEILKVARAAQCDAVVMGAPLNSLVCRILGGSVIHEVVSEAACPVFTVKPTNVACESKVDSGGCEAAQPNLSPQNSAAA